MNWARTAKVTIKSAGCFRSRPSHADRLRIGEGALRSLAVRREMPSSRSRPSNASRCGEGSCAACRESRPHERHARGDSERPVDSVREPRDAVEPRPPCPCARCPTRRRGGAQSPTSGRTGSTSSPPWAAHHTHNGERLPNADSPRSSQLQLRSAPRRRAAGARPRRGGAPYLRRTTDAGLLPRDGRRRFARARCRASLARAAPPWLRPQR